MVFLQGFQGGGGGLETVQDGGEAGQGGCKALLTCCLRCRCSSREGLKSDKCTG